MASSFFSTNSPTSIFNAPVEAFLSATPLTGAVRKHVAGVYTTLASMMAVTALTVYLDVGRWVPVLANRWISGLMLLASVIAFHVLSPTKPNLARRSMLLAGIAVLKGVALVPFVETLGFVSPRIVPQATVYAATLFASFSLAAMNANRRAVIYTTGAIGAVTAVSLLSLLGRLFGFGPSFSFDLVLGIVAFSLYIVLDTQVMIFRAQQVASWDAVTKSHMQLTQAAELYEDLVALFVRIAMFLAQNESRKKKAEEEEDDRRGRGSTRRR
ncbi:inhibitor of apoptosis-promoting Bax1-domain-containing protein [Blastocladiella britannica]|nr:inhibitor of apoptosis-promoting Bax1-domain-containing protein [Blastocladiella britannica]